MRCADLEWEMGDLTLYSDLLQERKAGERRAFGPAG